MKQDTVREELDKICSEIEDEASKIAGISGVFSDYWLVGIRDWVEDDEMEEKVLAWATTHYKLGGLDPLGCLLHQRLMLVALYIYLHRDMNGAAGHWEVTPREIGE